MGYLDQPITVTGIFSTPIERICIFATMQLKALPRDGPLTLGTD